MTSSSGYPADNEPSGKRACLGVAAVLALIVCANGITAPWAAGQRIQATASRPAPLAGPRVQINLAGAAGAEEHPPILALAGSTLTVTVVGKPQDVHSWQFGWQDTILVNGRLQIGEKGTGQVNLLLPDIRSRTKCTLLFLKDKKRVSRWLIVFPSARLAQRAELIRALGLGVIDNTEGAHIRETLRAEKVTFEHLSTQVKQDGFDGGAVVLAGFASAAFLDDACKRLQGRIEKGMFALIVNPPPKWRRWGIRREELSPPLEAAVVFAKDLGQAVEPADIGAGPWRSALRRSGRCRALAWVVKVSKDDMGELHLVEYPLIVARRIGRGCVVVALLPQVGDPLRDAVGRGILDELVLWTLKERFSK